MSCGNRINGNFAATLLLWWNECALFVNVVSRGDCLMCIHETYDAPTRIAFVWCYHNTRLLYLFYILVVSFSRARTHIHTHTHTRSMFSIQGPTGEGDNNSVQSSFDTALIQMGKGNAFFYSLVLYMWSRVITTSLPNLSTATTISSEQLMHWSV